MSNDEAATGGAGYSEAEEALYRKRFERLADPVSGMGLPFYDTLKDVPGANRPAALVMAKMPRVSPAALDRAMEYAGGMNSTALLIWQDGLIQAARYFGDTTPDEPLVSRSLAKPLAVIAVGRAIREGHIASLTSPPRTISGNGRARRRPRSGSGTCWTCAPDCCGRRRPRKSATC